jgi:uncharacterized membrane protein
MKTAENIKKVALIFFVVLGLTHILSGLMLSDSYALPTSLVVNRILDIPFAMSALLYGLAATYEEINEKHHKTANIIFIVISILVFCVLIYINFFIPDLKT